MTTAQAVGAVSREAAEWYAIDWQAINVTFADSKCVSCRQRRQVDGAGCEPCNVC